MRRVGPSPVAAAFGRLPRLDDLNAHRDLGQPLLRRELVRLVDDPRRRLLLRRDQVGADEREQRREPDEHGPAGHPPPEPERPGEPHDDQEREADEEELPAEREPVEEQPVDVPELGHVVAALPPVVEEPERHLDEPEDGEPEHPEQHPGADAAGGRLPANRPP